MRKFLIFFFFFGVHYFPSLIFSLIAAFAIEVDLFVRTGFAKVSRKY